MRKALGNSCMVLAVFGLLTWIWFAGPDLQRHDFIKPAHAQPTTLGPNVYAITATGSAAMGAVGANPTRRALTICNGHATQTVTFTFGTAITPVSLTTGQVLAAGNVANSCYVTPGSITSGIGAQINFIASGAGTPVTVFEY